MKKKPLEVMISVILSNVISTLIILVRKDFGAMQLATVSYGFRGTEFKNHIHFC